MKVTITITGNDEQDVEITRARDYVMTAGRRGELARLLDAAVADVRRVTGLDEQTGQPS